MASNERGFLYFYERVKVKKLVYEYKIQLASWNIGSAAGSLVELINITIRRSMNILCVQKTIWVSEISRV